MTRADRYVLRRDRNAPVDPDGELCAAIIELKSLLVLKWPASVNFVKGLWSVHDTGGEQALYITYDGLVSAIHFQTSELTLYRATTSSGNILPTA